jgi:hypothetical protein
MKYTLAFITLSLLLTACSRRAQIVGTWHDQSGALVFNSDGSYLFDEDANHGAGTWRISDKVLTITFTNSTGPHPEFHSGGTLHLKIVRIDSHTLSFDVGGKTNSFRR